MSKLHHVKTNPHRHEDSMILHRKQRKAQPQIKPQIPSEVIYGPLLTVQIKPMAIGKYSAERQKSIDNMLSRFPGRWEGFCLYWKSAAHDALFMTPKLPNPEEQNNFNKALAGNLGWALTGLITIGTGSIGILVAVAVAVPLAAAGSGAFAEGSDQPDIEFSTIVKELQQVMGVLQKEGTFELFCDVAGDACRIYEEDKQDDELWKHFCPKGYDRKDGGKQMSEVIKDEILKLQKKFRAEYLRKKAEAEKEKIQYNYDNGIGWHGREI